MSRWLSCCLLVVTSSRQKQTRSDWEVPREKCSIYEVDCSGICNSFTFGLLSLWKRVPDVNPSFHLRGKITRFVVCVCVWVCAFVWQREGKKEIWCSGKRQCWTVSCGLRRKEAFGQMTSFQPAFHIPSSLLVTKHIITIVTVKKTLSSLTV